MTVDNVTFDNTTTQPSAGHGVDLTSHTASALQIRVTLEGLFYVVLALLAFGLRVGNLDHTPLNDTEAHQALAALRTVNDRVPGDALNADSPLTFLFHAVIFSFAREGGIVAARLPIALAGVLLTLSPLLWRRYLNVIPPLIISLLFTLSPVALLASRTLSPVVWTMLLAVVALWLVLRYVETREPAWAVAATAIFAAMIFLAEPAGFLTVLALAFGMVFAVLTDDDLESGSIVELRRLWHEWPWANGVLAAGMLVVTVGTGLFWVPSGLTMIGHTVWTGARGFVQWQRGVPVGFPVWVALRYETGLVIFGLIACYVAIREGGFFERMLVGWALAGGVGAFLYPGANAAHALWLTVPLSVLVGLMITGWLVERVRVTPEVSAWVVPAHGVITSGMWLIFGLGLVLLSKRLLLELPAEITDLSALLRSLFAGTYNRNTATPQWITVQGAPVLDYVLGFIQVQTLTVFLISILNFMFFFLVGSLWDTRVAWRGFALGTVSVVLLFSFGLGGRTLMAEPGDPREYWYTDPVTSDIVELRATVQEMSLRDTGTPHLVTITALVPPDGALAWALREYENAVFVDGVGPEVMSAIVIMPQTDPPPDLGADYVGKDLVTRWAWDSSYLSWHDALIWFYRNDSQFKPVVREQLMFWVRKDVYGVEQVLGG